MRESLFDKLKNRQINIAEELNNICLILDVFEVKSFYSQALKISPFKPFYVSISTALTSILSSHNYEGDFKQLVFDALHYRKMIDINCFLDFLEFFKTLYVFGINDYNCSRYNSRLVAQIQSIIDESCRKLGYEFQYDKENEYYRVKLKNVYAEIVAANSDETVEKKIYKYLMIRSGNVDDKRECIKSLSDDIEILCKQYVNINEYKKLKQFIQCVRHTKDTPKKEFPFYYEDEEKWLDKIFEMIISILSFRNSKEIVKEIVDLENCSYNKA